MRLLLDTGQAQRARQEAVEVVADERELATASLLDADTMTEALLAAGDAGAARRVATLVSADPDHPIWLSLQGRLAVAEGDLEAARDHLRSAVVRATHRGAVLTSRWLRLTALLQVAVFDRSGPSAAAK